MRSSLTYVLRRAREAHARAHTHTDIHSSPENKSLRLGLGNTHIQTIAIQKIEFKATPTDFWSLILFLSALFLKHYIIVFVSNEFITTEVL